MMTMSTLNRQALSRALLLSVAAVLTLMCLFTYTSTGFLKVLASTGDRVAAQSSIRPNSISSLFTTLKRDNRRLLLSESCTKSDISIIQSEMNPLPNGIPTFSVQIVNLCPSGCSITNIHVACGWFASATLINPLVFRRVSFNDCLVSDGQALHGGDAVSFEYSNSFQYPMRVEAAAVCL